MVDDLKRILEKFGTFIINLPPIKLIKYRYRYNMIQSTKKLQKTL